MDKKTVLVVGGGGRCHAIVDALSRSEKVGKILCAPGNAGIAALAECVPLKDSQVAELKRFALDNAVDLTVVGPEASLAKGIVDEFTAAGLRIFGPTQSAARIESSKDFAKSLMVKYGVPTAAYRTFNDYEAAVQYIRETFPVVLKFDGLAAGKGVIIPKSIEEAEEELKAMLVEERFGRGSVVVEEFLSGVEFSFMCFVDGSRVWPLTLAQDHKRVGEGDTGLNTGGMGAYSPLPFVSAEDYEFALEKVVKPVAAAMVAEGCPFKGVLYGGLIKTAHGIRVIEFNCRFGDPETEVVLPRLESDIYDIFSAVADGTEMPEIQWSERASLGFVLASTGYPGSYEKGFEIRGLDEAAALENVRIYHMGTVFAGDKIVTSGGRVLMIVGMGNNVVSARDRALEAVNEIKCSNLFYRKDIGHFAID